MAACNINTLLASGKCFAALPTTAVVDGDLWCQFTGGSPPPPSIPSWFNPDINAPITNPDEGGVVVNPDI